MTKTENKKLSIEDLKAQITQVQAEIYKILGVITVGTLLLNSCTLEGQIPETQAAVSQTVEGINFNGEIELEEGVAVSIVTSTPENTSTITPTFTPEASPTPEFTPTTTATFTPEASPTPKIPEFPSDLVIDERYQFESGKISCYDWGGGYCAYAIAIFIRTQDTHLNEPFTLLDGRYHVQGWADAWSQETNGTRHHITVPLRVYDTQNYVMWKISSPWVTNDSRSNEINKREMLELNTGPWHQSFLAKAQEEQMCLTNEGIRGCRLNKPYNIYLGPLPTTDIYTNMYIVNFKGNVDFWRDLSDAMYTKEQMQEFQETQDLNILKINELGFPPNFIIPLKGY